MTQDTHSDQCIGLGIPTVPSLSFAQSSCFMLSRLEVEKILLDFEHAHKLPTVTEVPLAKRNLSMGAQVTNGNTGQAS